MKFFEKIRCMIRIYKGISNTEYMTNEQINDALLKHKDTVCSCGANRGFKDFFISTEIYYLRTYDVAQGKPVYCLTCQKCGQVTTYRYHHPHEVSLEELNKIPPTKFNHLKLVE